MHQEPMAAARRPRLGFVLWLTSTGVMAVSVAAGAVIALTSGDEGYGTLTALVLPVLSACIYAPIAALALIVTLIGLRSPGARSVRETLAIAGSINNIALAPLVVVMLIVGR